MRIETDPADVTVFAPHLPRSLDAAREAWAAPSGSPLTVSLLLHAPAYLDEVPAGARKPAAMQGGVGRETGEPRHGQVARLSQWDFGLGVGIWRLLDLAERAGAPVAVALDAAGVERMPGLGAGVAARAGEVVARGLAANVILDGTMSAEEEAAYLSESLDAVEAGTGVRPAGWFSPERSGTPRTPAALHEAGLRWFGDWTVDERPVRLDDAAGGITALPFSLETEDMFALYARGVPFEGYRRLLDRSIDQLVEDAAIVGHRFLGLSWFGWVLGQACFAEVAEHVLRRLVQHPDITIALPGELVAG